MKKYSILIAFVLVGCFSLTAQENNFHKMIDSLLTGSVKTITVDSLKKYYYDFQILDTREAKEYNTSHLKHAKSVGYNAFNASKTAKLLDKSKPVVVYCSIGYRSEKVGEKLRAQGFDVYNLYGGIFEWKNNNNSVIDATGKPTNKVHCFDKTWGMWLTNGTKIYE